MRPDKNAAFPNPNIPSLCYITNVVKNPNIIVRMFNLPPRFCLEIGANFRNIIKCGIAQKLFQWAFDDSIVSTITLMLPRIVPAILAGRLVNGLLQRYEIGIGQHDRPLCVFVLIV